MYKFDSNNTQPDFYLPILMSPVSGFLAQGIWDQSAPAYYDAQNDILAFGSFGVQGVTGSITEGDTLPISTQHDMYLEISHTEETVSYWHFETNQTVTKIWYNWIFELVSQGSENSPTLQDILLSKWSDILDFKRIFIINGSQSNDYLVAGKRDVQVHGHRGSDVIIGSVLGDTIRDEGYANDRNTIEGKSGIDRLIYSLSWENVQNDRGIVVNKGAYGIEVGDTVKGIEILEGTEDDDSISVPLADTSLNKWDSTATYGNKGSDDIKGNGQNNHIIGGDGPDDIDGVGGDDRLFGGDGFDFIFGGNGKNFVDGGAGTDVLFFESKFKSYRVDFNGIEVFIENTASGRTETVSALDIEKFHFKDQSLTISQLQARQGTDGDLELPLNW